MSLYSQQNTNEDQVLDNYIALWRQVIGDKRLIVVKANKPKAAIADWHWRERLKTCARCKKVKFYPTWRYKIYCGSKLGKTGCAYRQYLDGLKKASKKIKWVKKQKFD